MRLLLLLAALVAAVGFMVPVVAPAAPTTIAPGVPSTTITAPATTNTVPTTSSIPTTSSVPAPTSSPVATTTANDLYAQCRDNTPDIPILGNLMELNCDVGAAVLNPGDAVGEASKGIVGKAADELATGWKKGIALMFSWWYRTPITGSTSSDGTSNFVETVHSYLRYFQVAIFIVSIALAMVRIAWAQTGARGQHVMEAVTLAKRSVVVSGVVVGMAVLGDDAMRAASTWLLEGLAGGVSPAQSLERLMKISTLGGYLGSGLLFVFSLLGLIGVISQMMFILVQIAVSKLVLGVLPLAAAASGTEAGKQAYRKLMAWVVVFLLFPPATAIVYGTAFALAFSSDDAQGALAGMILLTLSAMTLPSLVRLLVPTAGQLAGGGGAAALGGAMIATGAVPMAISGGGGGGGSAERPASSGGRSDGDSPTGAVRVAGASQSLPAAASSGGGSAGGGAASTAGASGAASSGGGAAAGASGAAAAAGGPVGIAAAVVIEGAKKVASGARNATGGPDAPPPAGPTGGAPPSGGRSDSSN